MDEEGRSRPPSPGLDPLVNAIQLQVELEKLRDISSQQIDELSEELAVVSVFPPFLFDFP
jgi:hypothetical protein